MNRNLEITLLVLLVLAITAPLFYHAAPFYESSPDIAYIKAKILAVQEGEIFIDPVSGYDSLHPPLYHIFMAPLKSLGLSFRLILIFASLVSISLTIVFAYLAVTVAFDKKTALLTCLLIPFINDFMGSRSILLANAFYFSVPFYLAGLWLYLTSEESTILTGLSALLWGLAFFISPVYVFLIGLTFLHELLIVRRWRRFLILLSVFLVTVSPYIYTAISIYVHNLWGTSAFSLWRGIPDVKWLTEFLWQFISPAEKSWRGFPSFVHVAILLAAVAVIIKDKKIFWYIPAIVLAYILTYYHFSAHYAIRIHYLLSIFIVATAISGIIRLGLKPILLLFPVLALSVYSINTLYIQTASYYKKEEETYAPFIRTGAKLWANLDRHLVKGSYVFCTKDVYRYYIMTHFPVHSLGAYRTLEYFQLNRRVAQELEDDYREAMYSMDYKLIKEIISKYDIRTAIVSGSDYEIPLFQIIAQAWHPVYEDEYFVIYKRPW